MSQHERFRLATRDDLERKIDELGVAIPYSEDVSPLLNPVEIAGHRLPNRFVVQPMEGRDAEPDGAPGPLTIRRYQRYAAGGSGLIWFEATAVVSGGRANPAQLFLHDANVTEFQKLVAQTRAAARATFGEARDPLLIIQLTHSGRFSKPEGQPQPIIAQHSPFLDARAGVTPAHTPITDEDLDRLQDAYVHAVQLAVAAGFDGVDIKACHGYLISELLAAHSRTDSRYGGSFENRIRFLTEVVTRIRERVPDTIVTSRFNAFDGIPHPFGFGASCGDSTCEDLSEPAELARRLYAAGCPLLSVSIGNPYFNPHLGRPFDQPVAGAPVPHEHPLVGIERLLRITAAIQQAVPDVPVVGTGYSWLRQHIPNVAAAVIRAGNAGLIGLGRGAFAYPDCVQDLAKRGAFDPKKACIGCSGCSQIMRDGGCAGCIVHDQEIYAAQYREGRRRAKQAADRLKED